MESHLQKPGDWQGTTMIPASDTWAVFAFMGQHNDAPELWTEDVLGWVMAESRYASDTFATVFYGVALRSTRRGDVYQGPEVCEAIHNERGCHLGYSKRSLANTRMDVWEETAREHVRRCRRRRVTGETH